VTALDDVSLSLPREDSQPRRDVVEVDGIPMSGLVAEVAEPRAVIVALHGGATNSGYYDSRSHPRASLLRIGAALGFTVLAPDRPGFEASYKHRDAGVLATPESRTRLMFHAVDAFLAGRPRGAGVFLMAHSQGCVLATRMAASERGADLLGLEIAGTGRVPHPDSAFMAALVSPDTPPARPSRAALREALWMPEYLFPDGPDAALPFSMSPGFDHPDMKGWTAEFPRLAATVRVPVHITLGQFERAWDSGPEALADLASLFTASPQVVTAEQADATHNLSAGWTAPSYHLKVLSFAEECAVARERAAAETPPSPEADR
jgi:pimeloyl-ACP methyl ester carboxylesterase